MTEEEWAKAKAEDERIRHERERRMVAVLVAASVFQEALDYIASAQHSVQRTGLCPECDSEILPSQYCMMGHWCGEPPRR